MSQQVNFIGTRQSIADNSIGRVFIRQKTENIGVCYDFISCTGLGGASQDKTEDIIVRCPSQKNPGKYDILAKIPGELSDITFDLNALMSLEELSLFRKYFKSDCLYDMSVHYGLCTDPSNFATYKNALVFENVSFSSYSTGDLVSLSQDGKAPITQTISGSATSMYQHLYNLRWTAVATYTDVDADKIYQLSTDTCDGPCNFTDCADGDCSKNFVAVSDQVVEAVVYGNKIYTVSSSGSMFAWDYSEILKQLSSCSALNLVELEENETIISGTLKYGTASFILGTSDGRVIEYNLVTQDQTELADFTSPVTSLAANDYGHLVGTQSGTVYYAGNSQNFVESGAIGSSVSSVYLYSFNSWFAGGVSGLLHYTNNSGGDYIKANIQHISSDPITNIEATNSNIIHAVNSGRYYQSIDSGCTWTTIDLSAYLSEITDVIICKSNPFIVYLVGVTLDGTQACIIKSNFGV